MNNLDKFSFKFVASYPRHPPVDPLWERGDPPLYVRIPPGKRETPKLKRYLKN